MIVGFTGTRDGMSAAQKVAVSLYLKTLQPIQQAFHGGCVGADIDFDDLFVGTSTVVHVYPSNIKGLQGRWQATDIVHPEAPPLTRNCYIVDAVELIIATPRGYREQQRSGTWAAVRYARTRSHLIGHIFIFYPDGHYELDRYYE